MSSPRTISWLQVAPLALIMICFVLLPMLLMIVVSFLDYGYAQVFPEFSLDSWTELFRSRNTLALYGETLRFVATTWASTLVLGFLVAYFIIFHVRTARWRRLCFFACAIPFWTSAVIRMISWTPFLGRGGLVNSALMSLHLSDQPITALLFSSFSVQLVYIHTMTLMMIAPIANSMSKIDQNVIVAARDAGASEWQIIWNIVIPLARAGIALGTIFILTSVAGDFIIVKQMSGNQIQTVVGAIALELSSFQYPPAAAKSVFMLVIVLTCIGLILRTVDIRKELAR